MTLVPTPPPSDKITRTVAEGRNKPVIFSAPMVQALLAGRKSQTRRVLKPQPPVWANFCEQPDMLNVLHQWVPSGLWRWSEVEQVPPRQLREWPIDADGSHYWLRLPYAIGDRLWVKETWAVGSIYDRMTPSEINPDRIPLYCGIRYAANMGRIGIKDRSCLFMPRWASRLTLTVTSVKVERLQDISEADALAEGVSQIEGSEGPYFWSVPVQDGTFNAPTPAGAYRLLWNDLHGLDAWAANPWVVAITFTVEQRNIDARAAS